MIISLQVLQDRESELEAILNRARKCNGYLVDEELDENLQHQDEEAFLALEEQITKASQLCQEMIITKTTACLSQEIKDSLTEIEDRMEEDPEKDYSDWYPDVTKLLDEMAEGLRGSTLALDHELRNEVKLHKARLGCIRASTRDTNRIKEQKPPVDNNFKLNKITVPPFRGGLENWQAFWAKFKSAVHDHTGLSTELKNIHLQESIKDPSLEDYMRAAQVNHVPYDTVIANLQQRYDKPRELHSIYCHKLAELQPIKGTPAELSQAADTVFAAVTGLIEGGQSTIKHIATSLVAPILPKLLRTEWETRTDKTRGVADIFEWIDFMRGKANSINHEQKAPQHSFSRPPKEVKKSQKPKLRSESKVYLTDPQPAAVVESSPPKGRKQQFKGATSSCKVACTLCSTMHFIFQCKAFLDMSVPQRRAQVQLASLCSNCLRSGHSLSDCQSSFRCRLCKQQHNILLHTDSTPSAASVNKVQKNSLVSNNPQDKEKLMMTSQVILTGPTGNQKTVTAMLDSGAGVSVLSKQISQPLQLQQLDEWLTLNGIEAPEQATARPTSLVTVSSPHRDDWSQVIKVTVLPKVTTELPRHHLQSIRDMPYIQSLSPLADPLFHEPKHIDLILDVDFMDSILLPEKVTGPPGTPSAWKTELGWGVMGRYVPNSLSKCPTATVDSVAAAASEVPLDKQLERFWVMEELPKGLPPMSSQEEAVQEHYALTHLFSPPAGRYIVTLPKRVTTLQLGESRQRALTRFLRNEQGLLRKGNWTKFQEVVQEYLTLGHAQPVTAQELCLPVSQAYYLPMHAVFKQSSTSTKLRVVFDASSPTTSGASLNDILAAGSTLHPNLDHILIKFRSYRVALSGDVAKMYREVSLCESDRQLHRFLWRADPAEPISDFCMNKVTFGVTASPYVAVRTLQQTASDFSEPNSKATWHIKSSFYVDDLLAGADDTESALKLYQELRKVLLQGGFDLRKWRSSSPQVLSKIPQELQELLPKQEMVDAHTASYPKTLGITWDSRLDVMVAQVQLPENYISTKRGVVSDTAKSFDVLGWLSPFILRMKVLFQSLWREKIGWDTPLSEDLKAQHVQWRSELSVLKDITLPRCYFSDAAASSLQLHGFSDASEKAYAAVVYVRATYVDGSVTSRLVMAKTRVAPLKTLSVPRL